MLFTKGILLNIKLNYILLCIHIVGGQVSETLHGLNLATTEINERFTIDISGSGVRLTLRVFENPTHATKHEEGTYKQRKQL